MKVEPWAGPQLMYKFCYHYFVNIYKDLSWRWSSFLREKFLSLTLLLYIHIDLLPVLYFTKRE